MSERTEVEIVRIEREPGADGEASKDGRDWSAHVRYVLADELVSVTEQLRDAEAQIVTARTVISMRGREIDRLTALVDEHVQRERDVRRVTEEALVDAVEHEGDARYYMRRGLKIVGTIVTPPGPRGLS